MAILKRTRDTWRELSWSEYKKEREKDGRFSQLEKSYFDDVSDYTTSVIAAVAFSPSWARVAGVKRRGS